MKLFLSVLFCICLTNSFVTAQAYEVGASIGGTMYFGDMDAPSLSTNLRNTNLAVGAFLRNPLNNRFLIRGNLLYGKLSGSDSRSNKQWQLMRNLSFHSQIFEASALLEYNIFDIYDLDIGHKWTPYLVGGIAYLHHNPKTIFQGQEIELQNLGTEGQGIPGFPPKYSKNLVTIPMGIGLKMKLGAKWFLQLEAAGRITFFDYLDDLSSDYVNYFELLGTNGMLAADLSNRTNEYLGQPGPSEVVTGTTRGNPDVNDFYYSTMISIYYIIGRKSHRGHSTYGDCPTF